MKKAAIISGVFISGLIGAGFATGSEIYFYFTHFGIWGLCGILIAAALFSYTQYAVLNQAIRKNSFTIDEYLLSTLNKPIGTIISSFSYIFMIFILSAMMSGFGEMLFQLYGIKKGIGAFLMLFLTVLTVKMGYKGFVSVQSILSIVIVAMIISVCTYLSIRESSITVFKPFPSWANSAVCYVGYNMLTAIAVLCILAKNSDKQANKFSAAITFLVLTVLMSVMWYVIFRYDKIINLGAIPILKICTTISSLLGIIYSIAIFFSMLTTAVSSSYAIAVKCRSHQKEYLVYAFSYLLSGCDFSFIVDRLYRAGGIISIGLILSIIVREIIENNNNKKVH